MRRAALGVFSAAMLAAPSLVLLASTSIASAADMLVTPAWLVADLFKAAGVKPGDTVVSYCHIGQQATLMYFAAKRLGYKARLYDGSWDEWSRRSDLPVEKSAAKP